MINGLLDDPLFADCAAAAALRAKPLGFVDVGARGGIHTVVEPLAGVTAVLGFEPDADECARMREQHSDSSWAEFDLEPCALAGKAGPHSFHILAQPVNSSLLRPNAAMAKRYRIDGFRIDREVVVDALTLDGVLFGNRGRQDYWGEFLKLDAQGAELDILRGATRTLAERTVAAIVEVELCALYENQPLFSDVEAFMRDSGFTFFGFSAMSYRSGRLRHLLGKGGPRWRERLIHADAVFFKDPLAPDAPVLSGRAQHALFACAMLLGYFDLALEVALESWASGAEAERIQALASKYAQAPNHIHS
jgi:FkbM family methyltransferase